MTGTGSLVRSATALLIALGSAALLAEMSVRLLRYGSAAFSIERMDSIHNIGRSGMLEASPYPEIVYQLKPGLRGFFKLAPFRTSSVGLVDDEYPVHKPPGEFRIVVIGSSYSMPSGLTIEDSWHGRLERELNGGAPHGRFAVINFAVGGYDVRQMAATLRHRAASYSPDLVLVDVTRQTAHMLREEAVYQRRYEPHPATHPFFHSFALDVLLQRELPADPFLPPAESEREFAKRIGDLPKIAAEIQVPLCFVILQHEPWNPAIDAPLRTLLDRESAGAPVIDSAPAFRDVPLQRSILYAGDTHPNAAAHAIFARVILAGLREHGLVPRISP